MYYEYLQLQYQNTAFVTENVSFAMYINISAHLNSEEILVLRMSEFIGPCSHHDIACEGVPLATTASPLGSTKIDPSQLPLRL